MKKILIIYPHWPPSNLAGVHRARLIANFLPEFGWSPTVITVSEEFYEEKLDNDIIQTVRDHIEVIKVKAKKVNGPNRMIGDISLRAFSSLKRRASSFIESNTVDFIWIPIPAYYTAIIGRQLYEEFKIPYGIDYIDPWVKPKDVVGSIFSKSGLSNVAAKLLEPYAVKKAALLSGVDLAYFSAVLQRNPSLSPVAIGMPYGFDPRDHEIEIQNLNTIWSNDEEVLLYAGAFLPKSHLFLKTLFSIVNELKTSGKWKENCKIYFLGTGKYPGKTIKEYAMDYNIDSVVKEVNDRFPFLTILNFLSKAKGILVLGSVERHYTASKIFQSLLSKKPVFPVFHHQSSVNKILKESNADDFLVKYFPDSSNHLYGQMESQFLKFINSSDWSPNLSGLDKYSARESARILAEGIENALKK